MEKTIFEKVPFKYVLLFCTFLIMTNVWQLIVFIADRPVRSNPFLLISMGLLLIVAAIFIPYRKEEKIAISLIGLSSITSWLIDIRFLSVILLSSCAILLNVGAIYFFWASHKIGKSAVAFKLKLSVLLLILVSILVLPALFLWLTGLLSNITR